MVDKSGRSALFSAIQTIPKETDDYLEEMDETNYMNMHSSTFRSEFPSNRYYASKEIVSELLTHGADVNLQDYDGDDVVTTFCRSGSDTDIGETLIKANDLNLNTEMFYVQLALTNKLLKYRKPNWVNFLCLLMNKGASPNIFKGKVSNLIDVTAQGNHCLVEGMLKNGANINFADPSKRSALHYSCILKNPHDRDKIIRLLVKYGADLNCRSITREKPLDSIVNSMTHDIGKHGTVKYDQDCFKEEVDLSLLNLFICGGSDLCPIKKLKKDTLSLLKKCNSKWSENLIEGSMDYSYRSVLLTLLQTGLLKTAEYIIRSGWKVERERWFSNLKIAELKMSRFEIWEKYRKPDVRDATDQFQNFIDSVNTGPKTLSIVCRKEIRQQLVKASRGAEIETKINLLPIPVKIKSFLALKDFMQDTEVIKFGEIERYN
ncbi:Hypothetical predicted protein [Mytilus galloprovincialis]|uniref:SOCS box domain-containing protein n=1 Tax=Mytilus galloprovincialis TaxID=29158 RepID=A0A8B6E091_MYTGA|nr:Hypothetical predicted protein [Mytilus galloprovincialis]